MNNLAYTSQKSDVVAPKIEEIVRKDLGVEAPVPYKVDEGDAEVAGKLNGSKDLLKKADKFARTKSDVGGGIKRDRYFKVAPAESGSVLVVGTLPRATSMGMGATTDAKDFVDLAKTIEDLL
jgi:hypothetical protein